MKNLLHIGMPKCMSTAIQAWLREAPDVYFAGIGPSQFVAPDMLEAFQRHIARTPAPFYDERIAARVFDRCLSEAHAKGTRLFAFSDESIPYPIAYGRVDVSFSERLERLKAAMPDDTDVLMITRRPSAYLRSLYKYKTINAGMNFTYDEFLRRLLLRGDTYILSTIKYAAFADEAAGIFGHVRVIAMEDIARDDDALLNYFRELGSQAPAALPRENTGMADTKFANFRELYAMHGDAVSNDDFNVMTPTDRQRAQKSLGLYGQNLAQVMAKDQVIGTVRQLAGQLPDRDAKTVFAISDNTRTALADYVADANARLKAQYGIDTDGLEYGVF